MIGPVPEARRRRCRRAVALVAGILLGSRSVTGAAGAAALVGLSLLSGSSLGPTGGRPRARRPALVVRWLLAGFRGPARIAMPAETAAT